MTTDTIDPRRLTGWQAVVIDEDTDGHGQTFQQYIVRDARRDEVCKVFFVTKEGAAQAHLIEAAPELLAAAHAVRDHAHPRANAVSGKTTAYVVAKEQYDALCAAIAKAESAGAIPPRPEHREVAEAEREEWRSAAHDHWRTRPALQAYYGHCFDQGWDAYMRHRAGDNTATRYGSYLANTTERLTHEAGWTAADRFVTRGGV